MCSVRDIIRLQRRNYSLDGIQSLLLEDEIEDIPPSIESLAKAKETIGRGLGRAMSTPTKTPEEIWADFDALRSKIQASQQEDRIKERA